MVVGTLVHSLFQKALSLSISLNKKPKVQQLTEHILKSHHLASICYANLLSMETVKAEIYKFIGKIDQFLSTNLIGNKQQVSVSFINSCIVRLKFVGGVVIFLLSRIY